MRKVYLLLIALILVWPAGLVWAQAPQKGGGLVISVPDEPPGLDPTANTAAAIDRIVYHNIFEPLIRVDRNGKFQPCLAEKWEASADGKVYTFHLRQGVKFHNGEAFNAQVAKWNLERGAAPTTKNAHPEYFRGIEKMDTPDDKTLVVTLKNVDALFIAHIAEGDSVMLPMKGYEEAASKPIGTGPFKFVNWTRGNSVEMTRFEGYWDKNLPYLDKVTFRFITDPSAQVAALKAGDVQAVGYVSSPESAVEFSKDKNFKVISGTTPGECIISTNNKAKPFDDVRVRRAMAHAIDRKQVIELAMFGFGTPIGSHWCPSTPYYVDLTGLFPYDPAKAKALLKEAGYPDGFEAVMKLPAPYSYSRRSGEVVADMLGKVGIKLKLEVIEWGQWIDRVFKNKDYQLTIIAHVEPWDIGIYANPNYYFQYDSQRFRDAYQTALKAPNEEAKAKAFAECQKIIAEDAVNGYLFSAPSLPVLKANVMGWWENYPAIALDVTEVWLKK
ncbi:MAG: ABC transporter substrate-binding protein [Thermodesulfobacteriota bacterium]